MLNDPINLVDTDGLETVLPSIGTLSGEAAGTGILSNPVLTGIGLLLYPSPVGEGSNIVPKDGYYNDSKDTRKKIKGLQDQIDKHKEKIREDPDSRDIPHWEKEIKAWEERIKRLKKRLTGKQCQ